MFAASLTRDSAIAAGLPSPGWLRGDIEVNDALRMLGDISGIDLPLPSELESPSKRNKSPAHQIKYNFSHLFYLNRSMLEQEIRNFLEWPPVHIDYDDKVKFLDKKLTEAIQAYARSGRTGRTPGSQRQTDASQRPKSAPRSPTLSIKHAPDVSEQRDEIQLPTTRITSNNTSFVNTSFWSEVQKGSQDPHSPATTIDDSFYSTEDYGSSLSGTLQSKLAAAANEHLATASVSTPLDGANDPGTQTTRYGSSPSSSVFDCLWQAQSHKPALQVSEAPISPARQTAAIFASKYERVKNIAKNGLTSIRMPPSFDTLSFGLQAESCRLIQSCKDLTSSTLDQIWRHPRDIDSLHKIAHEQCPSFHRSMEASCKQRSLCARLRWTSSLKQDVPLLKWELLPPQKRALNAFQQKFGCDRFLFVGLDSLFEPPKALGLSDQSEHVRQRIEEMLKTEQLFLGRVWQAFYASEKTGKKLGESKTSGTHQLIYFALRGDDLEPLNLQTLIDFAVPLKENANMPFYKANARLGLHASQPLVTIALQQHEVQFVDDSRANGDLADAQFNDPNPNFNFDEKDNEKTVMNDGCSEAHESIFWIIKEKLDLRYVPSAAQFRCAGAKGIIFVRRPGLAQGDDDNDASRSRGPLIKITESQSKVTLKKEYDPHMFALNIVAVSQPLSPSFLYSDFIPILEDRHVPSEGIKKYAATQAERDMDDFLKALDSPESLREWIYRQNAGLENFRRDTEIVTLAGFPKEMTEKAIQLLEAGFDATKFEPLAELVKKISKGYLKEQKKNFKIQIGKSTMAIGIADPSGTLKPGEIQLNFSLPFEDPASGRCWSHLSGPVLVTRHPSARSSDVQKVRAVYRPELSHILDVVIFSSKGRRPLADKCSGGDYDGDKFWVCWEDVFVKHFLNAPAPSSLPDPESYGIKVDQRPLEEVFPDLGSEHSVREFAHMGIVANLLPSLLGTITKTLEKLKYRENSLSSRTVEDVTNIKDLIMDSKKNGRTFTPEVWSMFKKDRGISDLPLPAYANTSDDESLASANPANILDNVYCLIVRPIISKAHDELNKKLANASAYDEDLVRYYEQTLADASSDSVIRVELTELQQKLLRVKDVWHEQTCIVAKAKLSLKPIPWETAILPSRALFDQIQPDNLTHATVVEWLRSLSEYWPTDWDLLKTSALAKFYHSGQLWHNIAGGELCILKMLAAGKELRPMTKESYKLLKFRRRKRLLQEIAEDDLADGVELDVDMDE